jgi:formate C-acetyltransferase
LEKTEIWKPSENMTERIKRQREYYWLDEKRPHNNNMMTFTTGLPDDLIEFYGFLLTDPIREGPNGMGRALIAMAEKLDLPKDFWNQLLIVRRAMIFRQTLRQIPTEILPDELVVGLKFATGMSAGLSEKEIKEVAKLRGSVLELTVKYFGSLSSAAASQGHLIADHQTVLEKGFKGLRDEAEANLKKATSPRRKTFYESVIICCDGVKEFAHRYAEEARRMAEAEKNDQRKKELLGIAENCDWVPWNTPRTFWEALQSLWFQHMLIMLAENYPGPGTSFGRIDQYLIPYYQKDVEAGRTTAESAKELIQSFMVKANYAYDYSPAVSRYGRHAGDGQLWTVGGKGIGDKDTTNDLTYLFVEAFYELNMLEPKANVRIHSGTPKKLLDYVADITRKTQGAPFILNFDKSVIESLENQGLTHEEAVEYAPIGCLENTIRGSKAGTVDCHFNLAKGIELVFTRGRDYLPGGGIAETVGIPQEPSKCMVELCGNKYGVGDLLTFDSGDPCKFKTFEEFLEVYESQLKATLDLIIELQKTNNKMLGEYQPCPYLSMFITGCMEDGRDVHEGGGRYNPTTINGVGIGTVADSLAVVKRFVFEEKKVSMEELAAALYANWKGSEELRLLLLNKAPKFGNDDDYVDLIARHVSQW